MHDKTLKIIYKWLNQANYKISLTQLQTQFLSHPDVGTLSSITDTLNDFNIANQAAQIEAASLNQLTEPFIAFIKNQQIEQFVLVSFTQNNSFSIYNGKDETFTLSFNEFAKIFGGIIIAIDKQAKTINHYSQVVHYFLKMQSVWCVEHRLTLTSLLLINNKLFPLIYRTEDVRFHIEAVIEYEQTKKYESNKSFQSTKVLVDNTEKQSF